MGAVTGRARGAAREAFRRELARAARHRYPLGVALIDPGTHRRCGEYLCELRWVIGLAVRAGDQVCTRDSGDILILLPGMPDNRLASRIRVVSAAARSASRVVDAPVLRWGVAAFPRDGMLPDILIGSAIAAMQTAGPLERTD
ncbi:MAG: hypothetical protein RBT81_01935 [Gammaproteobacteria bacterium]|nr:hypothetical protein [Gammaproteobacteria bacterium]